MSARVTAVRREGPPLAAALARRSPIVDGEQVTLKPSLEPVSVALTPHLGPKYD